VTFKLGRKNYGRNWRGKKWVFYTRDVENDGNFGEFGDCLG